MCVEQEILRNACVLCICKRYTVVGVAHSALNKSKIIIASRLAFCFQSTEAHAVKVKVGHRKLNNNNRCRTEYFALTHMPPELDHTLKKLLLPNNCCWSDKGEQ